PILEADLSRARERGDEEAAARIHYMIGDALRRDEIGRWNDALSHYQQGLKLARAHRMVELEVRLHNGLGNTNLKTGKAAAALENYSEGLKIAQQIEGETTSVELMIGMGLAAQQMGKPDGTIEYFEAALEFASGPRGGSAGLIRRYRPTIVVSLGDAWYQKNDLDRAETYLKEALILDKKHALTPDIRYSLYGTQVEIHLARGEVEKARRHLPTLSAIAKAFPAAAEHLAQLESRLEL
nr:tetratricopeptide repeat protein [bacterium]